LPKLEKNLGRYKSKRVGSKGQNCGEKGRKKRCQTTEIPRITPADTCATPPGMMEGQKITPKAGRETGGGGNGWQCVRTGEERGGGFEIRFFVRSGVKSSKKKEDFRPRMGG